MDRRQRGRNGKGAKGRMLRSRAPVRNPSRGWNSRRARGCLGELRGLTARRGRASMLAFPGRNLTDRPPLGPHAGGARPPPTADTHPIRPPQEPP